MSRAKAMGQAVLVMALALFLAAPPRAWALGPFEKNPSEVADGLSAYRQGDYEGALRHFEAARQAMPGNPALEFDRANALYKLGRLDDAAKAYQDIAQSDQGQLQAQDYYNLGDAFAKLNRREDAIRALRRALVLDPQDDRARHNLEVLLRKLPPPPKEQPDGGTDGGSDGGADGGNDGGEDAGVDAGAPNQPDGGQDGGTSQAGDAGMDGGEADGGQGQGQGQGQAQDGGQNTGEPSEQEGMDGGEGDGGAQEEQEQEAELTDGGASDELHLNRQDALRILDSFKQDERNLQLWRFQQKRRPRKPNEKDW